MRPEATLTPDELADRLRISRWTAWRLGRTGAIPAHRVNRLMRFAEADVVQYQERNRIVPASGPDGRPAA